MKLTYWIADCLNDAPCYSVRAKTRREVKAELANREVRGGDYGKPRKVTVEYAGAFDLVLQCTGEGGLYEGKRQ
jgi:hypothetical protein